MNTEANLNLYDITPIPKFAYEPGWPEWSTLLLIAALIGLIILVEPFLKKWRQTRIKSRLVSELQEIESLLATNPQYGLNRLSLIMRRILSLADPNTPFTSLSIKELLKLKKKWSSTYISEVIAELVKIEELRYSGSSDITPGLTSLRSAREHLLQIIERIEKQR